MKPMELLLLTRSLYSMHGYGGMERHCSDWILAMSARGCRIHVVTMPPLQADALSGFDANVAFYLIPGKQARRILPRITSYPRWVNQVNRFLKGLTARVPVAAVYAHGMAAAGCEGLNIPVVMNPHGMEEFKTSGLKYLAYASFRGMVRRGAHIAKRVIATDQTLVPEIKKFLDATDDRIALIPNAVRLDIEATGGSLIPLSGDPLMLAAGRMETNKGFHVLVEALSRARNLPPDWKLVLAGAGSQEERLKHLVLKKGLRGKIAFLGPLDDASFASLFERADLFVNPTLFEGSSLVTLEAMKHELPVLASRTGGLPDKVVPGRNGWLVAPGDPTALATALETACAERASWRKMGSASAQIVQAKYSWDAAAAQFLALFDSLK